MVLFWESIKIPRQTTDVDGDTNFLELTSKPRSAKRDIRKSKAASIFDDKRK